MGLPHTALTSADLMNMPDPPEGHDYELSDGELIVVGKAGFRHERIKSRIFAALVIWADRQRTAAVFSESMFSLGELTARIPDVALVSSKKLDAVPEEDILIPFAPDLAIEVVSNSESARDAEKKVREYLHAGVEEVWQVYPDEQLVRVRRNGSNVDFTFNQTLTSAALPGFETRVQAFFVG